MFYFNSPSKPFEVRHSSTTTNITSPRCRTSAPRKAVETTTADMMSAFAEEHTFVASFADPVFCPNTAASLTIPASFSVVVAAATEGRLRGGHGFEDHRNVIGGAAVPPPNGGDDDDDIVVGGVAVSNAANNHSPANTINSSGIVAALQERDCHDLVEPDQHGPVRRAEWVITDAQQMSLLQSQLRTRQQQHNNNYSGLAGRWLQSSAQHLLHSTQSSDATAYPDSSSIHTSPNTLEFWQQRLAEVSSWHGHDIHQDALPVDHPHRFYDVCDFMDNWAILSQSLDLLQARRRLVGMQHARDISRSDLDETSTDTQGIAWSDFNITRQEALDARRRLRLPRSPISPDASSRKQSPVCDPRYYKFHSFHARHKASTAHYQLRNALTATSRAEIFYASDSTVFATSLAVPSTTVKIMDFNRPSTAAMPFRITCLGSHSGYDNYRGDSAVIAGGFNGEYAVLNLASTEPPHEGFVSHAYDGLVTHIDTYSHRRSGRLQAAFSSNDCCVRVMNVASLTVENAFRYDHAINATSVSPDGRLRLLVGDHSDALITDAEKGTPLVRLGTPSKDGFACAWSTYGNLAATAGQDGTIALWDTRNWSHPLHRIECMDTCARSLHFTSDNKLVFAENEDVVSIFDVGTQLQQDVRFFGSIAGTAVLDGGSEILVANSDRNVGGLMALERSATLHEQCQDTRSAAVLRRNNERLTEAFSDITI